MHRRRHVDGRARAIACRLHFASKSPSRRDGREQRLSAIIGRISRPRPRHRLRRRDSRRAPSARDHRFATVASLERSTGPPLPEDSQQSRARCRKLIATGPFLARVAIAVGKSRASCADRLSIPAAPVRRRHRPFKRASTSVAAASGYPRLEYPRTLRDVVAAAHSLSNRRSSPRSA